MTNETAANIIAATTEGDCNSGTECALVLMVRQLIAKNAELLARVEKLEGAK